MNKKKFRWNMSTSLSGNIEEIHGRVGYREIVSFLSNKKKWIYILMNLN